jgi:mono/diheme cytochrome c family protein
MIAMVALSAACKDKAPNSDAGIGAGAPVQLDSSAPTTSAAPVPVDSAPWDPDTTTTPSSLTPAKKDTTDTATTRKPISAAPSTPAKPAESPAATPPAAPQQTASTASSTELRDAYHKAPLDTVDGKTYQGWKYYNLNCARCHGEDVSGTTIAPHLITSLKSDGPIATKELFIQTVCEGRIPKGMPAWCQTGMTPAEIDTIYAYVKGRSDAKLHPGRPARAGG